MANAPLRHLAAVAGAAPSRLAAHPPGPRPLLDVARVLIADTASVPFTEGQPDLQLLERVLSGLRKL